MNALQKALARLKELMGELDALTAKDSFTAGDLEAIKAKSTEIKEKQAEIETLKEAEALRASAAQPAGATVPAADGAVDRGHNGAPGGTLPAAPERKFETGQKMSLIAAATLKAKCRNTSALKILADEGYARFAKDLETEMRRKAVDTTVANVLLPETVAGEFIELLRPETTFFQGGPKRVQFTAGQFKAPRGATGATASYVGEGAKKPVTEPSFDSIQMSAKKLAGIVLITEEARNWSLPNIDAYIRDDLRAAMAQATDLNAYFGTGAGNSPTGILNIAGVPDLDAQHYFANPLRPTITEIDTWASDMVLSLTSHNIGSSPTAWKWLMNYRTLEYLKNLRVGDDTGVYAYPELRLPVPTWKGFGILVTNQVPINGGASADETIIALIDFRHVLYGEEEGIVVKTSTEATVDVNGTLVHLWQQNMYGILMEAMHDFGLRHLHAVVKTHAVRWGATNEAGSP
jgi:HK97 family phage major capsid protein